MICLEGKKNAYLCAGLKGNLKEKGSYIKQPHLLLLKEEKEREIEKIFI